MPKPLLVFNLKVYEESLGAGALKIAKACAKAAASHPGTLTLVAPSDLDARACLKILSGKPNVKVALQRVDAGGLGKQTGHMPIEAAIAAGFRASILNHQEHRVPFEQATEVIRKVNAHNAKPESEGGAGGIPDHPNYFTLVVCAKDPDEGARFAQAGATIVAAEIAELIGTLQSLTRLNPQFVKDAVAKIKAQNPGVQVLAGAGVADAHDVRKGVELGVTGAILATAIVKSKRPGGLASGMLDALSKA